MMYHIVEFQERLGLHELTLDQNRDQFEREYGENYARYD